jgi:uridylate kinase
MRYGRVVVKLSGAALAGPDSFGLSSAALGHVARELLALADYGVQVAGGSASRT